MKHLGLWGEIVKIRVKGWGIGNNYGIDLYNFWFKSGVILVYNILRDELAREIKNIS